MGVDGDGHVAVDGSSGVLAEGVGVLDGSVCGGGDVEDREDVGRQVVGDLVEGVELAGAAVEYREVVRHCASPHTIRPTVTVIDGPRFVSDRQP
nr:hypothetical protein [Micromonospora sp. AKA38]